MRKRIVLTLWMVLALVPTVRADDVTDTADLVVAAMRSGEEGRLEELAEKTGRSPWLILDELLGRGEEDAAKAWAAASHSRVAPFLVAYLESGEARSAPQVTRDAVRAAIAAFRARDYGRTLGLLEGVEIPDGTILAVRVAELRARALTAAARPREAIAAWEKAAERADRIGWWDGVSRALNERGSLAYRTGDLDGAVGFWERRIEIEERHGTELGAAQALGNIGLVHRVKGELDRALHVQRRALAVFQDWKRRLPEARTHGNIGRIYEGRGDFDAALEHYLAAVAIMEEIGNREGIAINVHNVGTLHHRRGAYAKAFACYERALALDRARGDTHAEAQGLFGLAVLQRHVGQDAEASATLERVLKLARKHQDAPLTAVVYSSLASDYFDDGEYEKAHDAAHQALDIQSRMKDVVRLTHTLTQLAAIESRMGHSEDARDHYERALAIAEDTGTVMHMSTALMGLSRMLVLAGEPEKALGLAERALAVADMSGRVAMRALAWELLAEFHSTAGRLPEALHAARQAATSVGLVARGLAESQGAGVRDRMADAFGLGLSVALDLQSAADAAFFLEIGRAGTLLEALGANEVLRAAVLPAELRAAEAAARTAEARAAQVHRAARAEGLRTTVRTAQTRLEAARLELADVRARMRRESKAAVDLLYPEPDSLERIQGHLAEGEALVLYGAGAGVAAALVVTAESARLLDLGHQADVAAACAALVLDDEEAPDPARALARLRTLVLEPLGLGSTVKRLYVSPHGPLTQVPFALLAGDREVAAVPSGSVYGQLLDQRELRGEGVLALGDPEYGDTQATAIAVVRSGSRLAQLPATRDEVLAVGTRVLLGADATEAGFHEALGSEPRWRAVHLACHGLVRTDRPLLSSLALTPAGDDDGFLTALDVFGSHVASDIAVLSACETGRGRVVEGEGLVGLTTAFFLAGTPRVLASLWKVDDEATRALMERFYELWNAKDVEKSLTASAALRQAQAHVRSHEKWKHPCYWAAWVLWGLP